MINIIQTGALLNPDLSPVGSAAAVLVGLSTDLPKPTNAGNGWLFLEMDTCKKYLFDADNETWREWA